MVVDRAFDLGRIHIRDDQLRARARQFPGEKISHMSTTLNGDCLSRQIVASPFVFCRCLHTTKDFAISMRLRIARTALQSSNTSGLFQDVLHVGGTRAHIFRGDVFAGQAVYHTAMRTEELLAVHSFAIAQDDGLSTAKW